MEGMEQKNISVPLSGYFLCRKPFLQSGLAIEKRLLPFGISWRYLHLLRFGKGGRITWYESPFCIARKECGPLGDLIKRGLPEKHGKF